MECLNQQFCGDSLDLFDKISRFPLPPVYFPINSSTVYYLSPSPFRQTERGYTCLPNLLGSPFFGLDLKPPFSQK